MKNFWKDKKIVVTGSEGFVGRHLVTALKSKKAIVTEIPHRLYFEELCNRIKRQDYVVHLGAQTLVGKAKDNPILTYEANIKGTWEILEACRLNKTKKIIIASTDKVYGEGLDKSELCNLGGIYPYDLSKVLCDEMAQRYRIAYDMRIGITRCVNIYGPGDTNDSRIIPGTIKSCLKNEDIIIRSNGQTKRSYLYVEDVVEGYLMFLKSDNDGILNFGIKAVYRTIDIVTIIKKLTKSKSKIKILNISPNEIFEQSLLYSKAYGVLGWEPKTNLNEGLIKTILWHKKGWK